MLMPVSVLALGLSAAPAELDFGVMRQGQEAVKALTIKNPSNESVIFELSADDFFDWIRLEPKNFQLESHEQKVVSVLVKPQAIGVYTTDISVSARSISAQSLRASTGVKVPVTLRVADRQSSAGGASRLIRGLLDVLLVAGFVVLVWRWYKKKHQVA